MSTSSVTVALSLDLQNPLLLAWIFLCTSPTQSLYFTIGPSLIYLELPFGLEIEKSDLQK